MLGPSIGAYPDRHDSSDKIEASLRHLPRSSEAAGDRAGRGQDRSSSSRIDLTVASLCARRPRRWGAGATVSRG
ncbi:hypothetical protein DIJ64_09190 [Mycobacterium leprae]|uniref:Uncharacterized protein n=1 Tax=Mycobacterium leprae TaxID=1769 RepID=A0AAD0P8D0_MYCLR|nr:hypothetical protein DIJ64_09190 [Mycobacterium leprae]